MNAEAPFGGRYSNQPGDHLIDELRPGLWRVVCYHPARQLVESLQDPMTEAWYDRWRCDRCGSGLIIEEGLTSNWHSDTMIQSDDWPDWGEVAKVHA